ncbi:MAG: hypothetical protein J6S90_00165 [Lentisphaeria bacterium]|nr:hypothetical protein [Lentisphaeria bacterium]
MFISFVKRSQLLFLLSFTIPIGIGACLLKIPGVYKGSLSWLDSFYTSTSAVCVTGLSVVPTVGFSWIGQVIILLLIQLGGLGIVTMSASFLLFMGKHFSFDERLMMSTLNDDFPMRNAEMLIKLVATYTFVCEAIGWVIIFIGCLLNNEPFFQSLWNSLFISVASYCNAGFSPYPDSMISAHWVSKMGSSFMILTGSLGVYVIYDIIQRLKKRRSFLTVNTKLVLLATGILLVISTFTMHFKGDSSGELLSMVDSWYMSVSGCSAGFNSVDMESISDVALALIMFLMLVGGAPGSTAGGLKISTVAVAAAAIWSIIAGNRKTIVFKRHIPTDNVMRAFAVITLFAILVVIGSVAVKLSAPDENLSLGRLLFEAVSAICTVGLSIGDTSVRMETFGRIISMVLMYIGRIGPLTLLIFLLAREKPGKTGYPEERVIIG